MTATPATGSLRGSVIFTTSGVGRSAPLPLWLSPATRVSLAGSESSGGVESLQAGAAARAIAAARASGWLRAGRCSMVGSLSGQSI